MNTKHIAHTPPEPTLASDAQGVFLNLSNHPSETSWSKEQRAAAGALARSIVDLPFPAVPPTAGTDDVARLGVETLGRLPAGVAVAMVAGEMTLAFWLVAALQQRGVRCVAATTVREVVELGDGRRETAFRFVRFREYPRLAST